MHWWRLQHRSDVRISRRLRLRRVPRLDMFGVAAPHRDGRTYRL